MENGFFAAIGVNSLFHVTDHLGAIANVLAGRKANLSIINAVITRQSENKNRITGNANRKTQTLENESVSMPGNAAE